MAVKGYHGNSITPSRRQPLTSTQREQPERQQPDRSRKAHMCSHRLARIPSGLLNTMRTKRNINSAGSAVASARRNRVIVRRRCS